ncbi:MAG: hypothetical protein CL811_12745 [Colwelliaceae bacterium]|nr:hypothetical protein [Colwelliaceae bacterium]|tara:strand:+ start:627 stop:830 length:204 start_codon:yes stop_codon:yes gene_type:complete
MPRGVKKEDPLEATLVTIEKVRHAMAIARTHKTGALDKTAVSMICELAVLGGKQKLEDLVASLHIME